jgi:hypothetical protein
LAGQTVVLFDDAFLAPLHHREAHVVETLDRDSFIRRFSHRIEEISLKDGSIALRLSPQN